MAYFIACLFWFFTASLFLVFLFPKIGKDKNGKIPQRGSVFNGFLGAFVISVCISGYYNSTNSNPISDQSRAGTEKQKPQEPDQATDDQKNTFHSEQFGDVINQSTADKDQPAANPATEKKSYKGDEYPLDEVDSYQSNIADIEVIDNKLSRTYDKFTKSMETAIKQGAPLDFLSATNAFKVRANELAQDSLQLRFIELKNPVAQKSIQDTTLALTDRAANFAKSAETLLGMLAEDISQEKANELIQQYKFAANADAGKMFFAIKEGYESYGYGVDAISDASMQLKPIHKRTILSDGKEDQSLFAVINIEHNDQLIAFSKDAFCDKPDCFNEDKLDKYILFNDSQIKKAKYSPSEDAATDKDVMSQEKTDYHVALFAAKNIKLKSGKPLFDLISKCNKTIKSADVSGSIMQDGDGTPKLVLTYTIHPVNDEGKRAKEELSYELIGNKLKATSVYLSSDILTSVSAVSDYGYKCI
jgi:hypothetical protein